MKDPSKNKVPLSVKNYVFNYSSHFKFIKEIKMKTIITTLVVAHFALSVAIDLGDVKRVFTSSPDSCLVFNTVQNKSVTLIKVIKE